jgi:hypothetical protein
LQPRPQQLVGSGGGSRNSTPQRLASVRAIVTAAWAQARSVMGNAPRWAAV